MFNSESNDPIIQIAVSDSYLIVARQSGALLQFSLPNVILENQYFISHQPQQMQLNCDSTMLSLIDNSGILKIFTFSKNENRGSSDGLVKSSNEIISGVNIIILNIIIIKIYYTNKILIKLLP